MKKLIRRFRLTVFLWTDKDWDYQLKQAWLIAGRMTR